MRKVLYIAAATLAALTLLLSYHSSTRLAERQVAVGRAPAQGEAAPTPWSTSTPLPEGFGGGPSDLPVGTPIAPSAPTTPGAPGPAPVVTPSDPGRAGDAPGAAATPGLPADPGPASGTSGASGAPATPHQQSGASGAYTGRVVDTRFGPVQVQIVVSGNRFTSAVAVQSPGGDPRSQAISSRAVPELNQQAVTAQSAQLDGVSGATYTSRGYAESLQSAIDSARVR